MTVVEPIVTGAYLRAETQVAALAPGAGIPISAPSQTEFADPVSSGKSS